MGIEVQNKQSDHPYGYLQLLCVLINCIFDLVIYNKKNLGLVQFFQFYEITTTSLSKLVPV